MSHSRPNSEVLKPHSPPNRTFVAIKVLVGIKIALLGSDRDHQVRLPQEISRLSDFPSREAHTVPRPNGYLMSSFDTNLVADKAIQHLPNI